ncbi:hypothetical protein A2U01_0098086, partial [Trifolium medium]|nr:hypothetical protein [Trifolium medium]
MKMAAGRRPVTDTVVKRRRLDENWGSR